MSGQRVIALLGRPDAPTDAVEEYCRYLGEALVAEDFELIIERLAWAESETREGWSAQQRGEPVGDLAVAGVVRVNVVHGVGGFVDPALGVDEADLRVAGLGHRRHRHAAHGG